MKLTLDVETIEHARNNLVGWARQSDQTENVALHPDLSKHQP